MSEQPAETNHAAGGRWIPLESNPDVRTFNVLAVAINLCYVESSSTCLILLANHFVNLQLIKISYPLKDIQLGASFPSRCCHRDKYIINSPCVVGS